jgi:hypothetical protein
MAGVDVAEGAGGGVEASVEEGDEEALLLAAEGHELLGQGDASGGAELAGRGAEDGAECGHDEAGGDALAHDVGEGEVEVAVVEEEPVVEVAGDVLGGAAVAGEVVAVEEGSGAGEEVALDAGGAVELLPSEADVLEDGDEALGGAVGMAEGCEDDGAPDGGAVGAEAACLELGAVLAGGEGEEEGGEAGAVVEVEEVEEG